MILMAYAIMEKKSIFAEFFLYFIDQTNITLDVKLLNLLFIYD